jgi:4-hydroxy-3-methylbut-2-enyl diphosphate reductase
MQVVLAKPRGFCAGVDRAIQIVERALQIHGAPIYVRYEVVHNKVVTDDRRSKGAAKPRRAAARCSMQSARW